MSNPVSFASQVDLAHILVNANLVNRLSINWCTVIKNEVVDFNKGLIEQMIADMLGAQIIPNKCNGLRLAKQCLKSLCHDGMRGECRHKEGIR